MSTPTLSPASFIDEARLRSHLGRDTGAEDDIERRLTECCNRSIAWMEQRTRRRLKARNYRSEVTTTTSGSTAADATSITVASTASLYAGDDVFATGLDPGTQVQSITSLTAFVPSKKVRSTIASGSTLTFAGKPLVLILEEPTDARELYVPEAPVLADNLWAFYWVWDGVRTAIDLTNVQVEEETGRIRLARLYGLLSAGRYEIECRAGYEEPSATAPGHPGEWDALAAIQMRVAEIYFSDALHLRGRSSSLSMGNMSLNAPDVGMPADVEAALRPFWRAAA